MSWLRFAEERKLVLTEVQRKIIPGSGVRPFLLPSFRDKDSRYCANPLNYVFGMLSYYFPQNKDMQCCIPMLLSVITSKLTNTSKY